MSRIAIRWDRVFLIRQMVENRKSSPPEIAVLGVQLLQNRSGCAFSQQHLKHSPYHSIASHSHEGEGAGSIRAYSRIEFLANQGAPSMQAGLHIFLRKAQ